MKQQKQISNIPDLADRHLWQIQPIRDAAWIVVLVFVVWLGYAMRSVTVPLLGSSSRPSKAGSSITVPSLSCAASP